MPASGKRAGPDAPARPPGVAGRSLAEVYRLHQKELDVAAPARGPRPGRAPGADRARLEER